MKTKRRPYVAVFRSTFAATQSFVYTTNSPGGHVPCNQELHSKPTQTLF